MERFHLPQGRVGLFGPCFPFPPRRARFGRLEDNVAHVVRVLLWYLTGNEENDHEPVATRHPAPRRVRLG